MKLGILGTGKIVQSLMREYRFLPVEKTYVLATTRSVERAEGFGLDGVFTDYDALLSAGIDTVYVALPNDLHYAYTRKALEAGRDVILEKPATSDLRQLEELLAPYGYIYSPSKGILVNFHEVTQMTEASFTLSDGTVLPISRRKSKEIQEAYTKFRFQKLRSEVEV